MGQFILMERLLVMYKEGFGNIPNKDKVRYMLEEGFGHKEGKWVIHAHLIGKTAEKIAKELGLDSDIAYACGSLHDIAKAYSHEGMAHMMEGYRILRFESYFFPARLALVHGFVDFNIDFYHGEDNLKEKDRDFLENFLKKHYQTEYDRLIILLDNLIKYEYMGLEEREKARKIDPSQKENREKRMEILRKMEMDLSNRLKKPIKDYLPRPRYYKFPYNLFKKD